MEYFRRLLDLWRVKQARAQLEQSKVTYDDSVRQVELEVATSVSNLRQAALTVDSAQTGVNVNLEALRLADERLAAGTGTQLDVLNAQQQLTTARSNLVSAYFPTYRQLRHTSSRRRPRRNTTIFLMMG